MNENRNYISMDDIMQAGLCESKDKIEVSYKKTVLIRSYETEVVESSTQLELNEPITGIERMFITAILQIQLEYETYCMLASKGIVTQTQLMERKQMLEEGLYAFKFKADQLLGEGKIGKYLKPLA